MNYLIVIEETKTGFSAYSPDTHGCVSTGKTKKEVENNMQEAIELHLDGMCKKGYEMPASHSYATKVRISA